VLKTHDTGTRYFAQSPNVDTAGYGHTQLKWVLKGRKWLRPNGNSTWRTLAMENSDKSLCIANSNRLADVIAAIQAMGVYIRFIFLPLRGVSSPIPVAS